MGEDKEVKQTMQSNEGKVLKDLLVGAAKLCKRLTKKIHVIPCSKSV